MHFAHIISTLRKWVGNINKSESEWQHKTLKYNQETEAINITDSTWQIGLKILPANHLLVSQ